MISLFANAKPRIINIDEELKNAKSIEYCRIINFTDSIIYYELTYLKVVSNSTFSSPTLSRTAKLKAFERSMSGTRTSGSLPNLGEACYIIIDSLGFVSLFGIEEGGYVSFWSPIYTGSECLIRHSQLFICANKTAQVETGSNIFTCWTSVKISIGDFLENITRNLIECGSILIQSDTIMFIPDFAGSRAYTIKSPKLKFQDGQKLCVEWKVLKYDVELITQIE